MMKRPVVRFAKKRSRKYSVSVAGIATTVATLVVVWIYLAVSTIVRTPIITGIAADNVVEDAKVKQFIEREITQDRIPRVLIFTHYVNLLDPLPPDADSEVKVLQQNVHHSINMHPGATVRFLNDTACVESITAVLGPSTPLLDYFVKEKEGMFKADICRGAALYETGGIYLDVDVGVRLDLFDLLKPDTRFATVRVHRESMYPGNFFQAFMATTARHEVLERYLELFIEYYRGKIKLKGPLGVQLLRMAVEELNANVELWQEVKYSDAVAVKLVTPKSVSPPTWGTRRACKFIVVSGLLHDKKKNTTSAVVPLYSRIGGSRMCPLNP